jgi:type II secretory pathway pseudopilin PulG
MQPYVGSRFADPPCTDRRARPAQTEITRERGFTYIGVLFIVLVMGVGLASVGMVWHTDMQREKERELLFVGAQFRSAIAQYHASSPGAGRYPMQLEELVRDDRYPGVRRYLRRVYRDPMTGKNEWGLVKAPDGGILGVHSLAEGRPLKNAGFSEADAVFADVETYAEWKFVVMPLAAQTPAAPGAAAGIPTGGNAPGREVELPGAGGQPGPAAHSGTRQ